MSHIPEALAMERDGTSSHWSLVERIAGEDCWVAEVRFSEYETKQVDLARLIAAAPDLLTAAEEFLAASPMAISWPSYRALREAIAKATQGNPQ